jgi:hypothetical protein
MTEPTPPMDLGTAIALVIADFREESPDRAEMSDAEISAVDALDHDDIATLTEADHMSGAVADAYRAVLDARREHLDEVLAGAAADHTAQPHDDTTDEADVEERLTRTGDPGEPDLPADLVDPIDPTAPGKADGTGFVALDDAELEEARAAVDRGDFDAAESIVANARPYTGAVTPTENLTCADDAVVRLVCPECGEDAVEEAPTGLVPYAAHGQDVPAYAHPDGEPLCTVVGPRGYQPADPVEVLAGRSDDSLSEARAAVEDAVDASEAGDAGYVDSAPDGDVAGTADGDGWDR